MNLDDSAVPAAAPSAPPHRLYLREPGWRIGLKVGSAREFCFVAAPGQDYYHRLLDGEIYVFHGDEKLCLACAERRGLLSHQPKPLRQPLKLADAESAVAAHPSDFDIDSTGFTCS